MKKCLLAVLSIVPILFVSCGKDAPRQVPARAGRIIPEIVKTIPHDSAAFTQGLLFHDGYLYESTGLRGKSSIRRLDAQTGEIVKKTMLQNRYFGEGLARRGTNLIQLTWKAGAAIVYAQKDFSINSSLSYDGEGWGLTADATHFIMSNGSDTLYFRDEHFMVIRAVAVTLNGKPLTRLNELEYARNMIFANVWYSNFIFEIEPRSGNVGRIIDCTSLVEQSGALSDDVLNGIAYDAQQDVFFLTGKNWPKIFKVRIAEG